LLTDVDEKLRLDSVLEANYLHLGRDKTNDISEFAIGGDILYVVPGIRFYYREVSLGLGLKFPTWTKLNEEDLQQGSEGQEKYRVIFSFSMLFL
jgi:hypothetical protein